MAHPWWQERSNIFLGNVYRGDIGAALRAMMWPEHALPHQTLTLAEQAGLMDDESGVLERLMGWVANIATDPLVIGGIILSKKFPCPRSSPS